MVAKAKKADYPIGKNRPPKHGQIKPGEVRNPKGRGKSVPSIDRMVVDVGMEVIGGTDGRSMIRIEYLLRKTYKRAYDGDMRAAQMIFERWDRATSARSGSENLSAEDQRIMEELLRASRPQATEGGSNPAPAV